MVGKRVNRQPLLSKWHMGFEQVLGIQLELEFQRLGIQWVIDIQWGLGSQHQQQFHRWLFERLGLEHVGSGEPQQSRYESLGIHLTKQLYYVKLFYGTR